MFNIYCMLQELTICWSRKDNVSTVRRLSDHWIPAAVVPDVHLGGRTDSELPRH